MADSKNKEEQPRRRGRPRGRTRGGEATRQRLYDVALGLIEARGFERTTLRAIAREADVSVGLLYKYFPNKQAIVVTLHERLSAEYAERVLAIDSGPWWARAIAALRLSLEVLGPHRQTLRALVPVLVSTGPGGVLSAEPGGSRRCVEAAFVRAVVDADDAPDLETAEALGRLIYLAHLGVILWWLLDRSPDQRATARLIEGLSRQKIWGGVAMSLPGARNLVSYLDGLSAEAFPT